MNRIFIYLLLLIGACYSTSCYADEIKLIEQTDNLSTDPKDRPRKPAKIWLTCDANDGILTFAPSDYYVTLSVTVENEDTGESWEGIITDGNMSMEYSTIPGTYSITCVNESENIFVGNIYQ